MSVESVVSGTTLDPVVTLATAHDVQPNPTEQAIIPAATLQFIVPVVSVRGNLTAGSTAQFIIVIAKVDFHGNSDPLKNDHIFPVQGAYPYKRDLKDLEFHILDTGHFALEEYGPQIAERILALLDRAKH